MLAFIKKIFKIRRNKKRIYLDHASAAPISGKSIEESMQASKKYYANASSIHTEGEEVKEVIYKARKEIAKFIKAKSNEIYFTSSTTEANNIFIQGAIKNYNLKRFKSIANFKQKPHVISSRAEHSAILSILENLEQENLIDITYIIPKENGLFKSNDIKDSLRDNTILIAMSHINSEIGTEQNIREISKIIREYQKRKDIVNHMKNIYDENYQKILFFVDATQSVVYRNIDVNNLRVDGLSFGSHKIGGPAGAALLYVRKNTHIALIYFGGGQENGIKSGSENVPAIIGFAEAIKEISNESPLMKSLRINNISNLKTYFIREIEKINIEKHNNKLKVLGDIKIREVQSQNKNIFYFEHSSPHIMLLHIRGMLGEEMLLRLDAIGYAVSTASACSLVEGSGSNFLKSLNKHKESKETIRISLNEEITKRDIDSLIKNISNIAAKYS